MRWGYILFAGALILGISRCGDRCVKSEHFAEANAYCESAPKVDLNLGTTLQTEKPKSCVEIYLATHHAELKVRCLAKENVFSRLLREHPDESD
jgi:hypothetical protein